MFQIKYIYIIFPFFPSLFPLMLFAVNKKHNNFLNLFHNMFCNCSKGTINVIIVSLINIFFFVCVCVYVCLTFPVGLGTVGVGDSSCPHTKAHQEQTNIKCKRASYSTYFQLSV